MWVSNKVGYHAWHQKILNFLNLWQPHRVPQELWTSSDPHQVLSGCRGQGKRFMDFDTLNFSQGLMRDLKILSKPPEASEGLGGLAWSSRGTARIVTLDAGIQCHVRWRVWGINPKQNLALIYLLDKFLGAQLPQGCHPILPRMPASEATILVARSW